MGKGFPNPPVQCCCGQATGPLSVRVTVRGQQQDAKSLLVPVLRAGPLEAPEPSKLASTAVWKVGWVLRQGHLTK